VNRPRVADDFATITFLHLFAGASRGRLSRCRCPAYENPPRLISIKEAPEDGPRWMKKSSPSDRSG